MIDDAIIHAIAFTRDWLAEIAQLAGAAFFVAVVVTFGCVFGGGQ